MKHRQTQSDHEMDRLGQQLSAKLSTATLDLGHDISERLRIARQRALQSRPPMVIMQRRMAGSIQSNGTLSGSPEEGLNLWSIFASVLPLLILVFGLLILQDMQADDATTDIARIDAALLTDELPPDAYTDPGFVQFLKLQLVRSAAND
ncbi:MAG: hypothetical protein CFE38_07570 [Comamonadaceae bacterium PBBC1]|nr:MAG: hypothetical protein CFE38_07570 [Comamonadaceae bacterium PBBC1]